MLAQSFDIVGKGRPNACLPFATDLSARFQLLRVEANVIIYDWKIPTGGSGRHAIIVFRDAQNRLWGMDNLRRKPVWLSGEDPRQWIAQFSPKAQTRLVSTIPNLWAKNELSLGCPDADPRRFQDAAAIPSFPFDPLRP